MSTRQTESIQNLATFDPFLSLLLGVLAVGYLLRRQAVSIFLTLTGGYLLYRGVGGFCPLYKMVGLDSRAYLAGLRQGATVTENNGAETPMTDPVDEAVRESFPASDPPANW